MNTVNMADAEQESEDNEEMHSNHDRLQGGKDRIRHTGNRTDHKHSGDTVHGKKKKRQANEDAFDKKKISSGRILERISPQEERASQDENLKADLAKCLGEYSRQRLRAFHMSLRQCSNDDSRISNKELNQAFLEHDIKLTGKILQMLSERYGDHKGIDFERLYKFMTEAHSKTGRDSVLAMRQRNDIVPRREMSQEEIDEDLLWRIENLLVQSKAFVDITDLREAFQKKDASKTGKVSSMIISSEQNVPIFGALLKSLVKRCDEEKNDQINWPELVSFLERAQQNAWITCPDLKELPYRMKNQAPVEPSPLDELSSKTRNVLVNKFRKKLSLQKSDEEGEIGINTKNEEQETNKVNDNSSTPLVPAATPITKPNDAVSTAKKKPQTNGNPSAKPKGKNKAVGNERHGISKQNQTPQKAIPLKEMKTEVQQPPESPNKEKDNEGTNLEQADKGEKKDESTTTFETDTNTEDQALTKLSKSSEEKDSHVSSNGKISESNKLKDDKQENGREHEESSKLQAVEGNPSLKISTESSGGKEENILTMNIKGKTMQFSIPDDIVKKSTIDPPDQRLKLHWVYGYRGNDCRNNIYMLYSGEIVYFMSYIAVIYHVEGHRQRHYREHTADIKCITVHSNGILIATGQFSGKNDPIKLAHIRVWRSDTLQTLHILGLGEFEKAVACVSFALEQDILAAVDNSSTKKLSIWDTNTGVRCGETNLNTELICDIGFNKKYPEVLVTVGKEHIAWFKIYPDSKTIQLSAQPDYESFLKAKFVITLVHNDTGDLITGDSNGTIYIWGDGGNKITNFIKHAHDGPVFTLLCCTNYLLSGGRDGLIHCWQWNKNMTADGTVQIGKANGGVRTLLMHASKLLIGTTMNALLSAKITPNGSPIKDAYLDEIPITQCHYDDLRGLSVLPRCWTHADVVTAGLDGLICFYDSGSCKSTFKQHLKGFKFVCVDMDITGQLLALGSRDGHLHILEWRNDFWDEKVDQKLSKDRLDVVKFSPVMANTTDSCVQSELSEWKRRPFADLTYLTQSDPALTRAASVNSGMIAVGGHDGAVYIYTLRKKIDQTMAWELHSKLQGHGGAINGLDWSSEKVNDTYLLRSTSTALELQYWTSSNLSALDRNTLSGKREWTTNRCKVDASFAGALCGKQLHDVDVITLDLRVSDSLLAVGDNKGNINLFRYPCINPAAFSHGYKSHDIVQNLCFTLCGRYLLSVGGRDSCLIQWEII